MGMTSQLAASRLIQPGVCTSTTRPASPFKGQCIYETDTDMMAIWNGTAWRYIAATTPTNGAVLQVVTGSTSTEASSSSTSYADTNLSATITPKSSASKILVLVNQEGCVKTSGNAANALNIKLLRGTTEIQRITNSAGYTNSATSLYIGTISGVYLDSPATTSATTYKTQFANDSATAAVRVQDGNVSLSTITLMEIAG